MKNIKSINKKAVRITKKDSPDVFAYSPLPKPDCTSDFRPGIEVHACDKVTRPAEVYPSTSSTDMTVSTQGLCSPFYRDTMICGCNYWPAHDPDFKLKQTKEFWSHEMGHKTGQHSNPHHSVDFQDLRFVYQKDWGAKDSVGRPLKSERQGADAWDKSDPTDITDILIKDNDKDNGKEPSASPWWESPDIFVRNNDDSPMNFTKAGPSDHQNPIAHQKNFLYARIRNISKRKDENGVEVGHTIDHIYVKFYAHWSSTNPTAWEPVGHAMVRDMPPGIVVVKSIKPWIPQKGRGVCLMVIIDSTQDPVKILGGPTTYSDYEPSKGPQPKDVSVINDNNIAQRNMTTVLVVAGWASPRITFDIRPIPNLEPIPPHPKPVWHRIEVERPTLPRETDIPLNLPDELLEGTSYPLWFRFLDLWEKIFQFFLPILKIFLPGLARLQNRILKRIPLRGEEIVDASFDITILSSTGSDEEHKIVIKQYLRRELLGGITTFVRIVAPVLIRVIGNVETKEVHLAFCPEIRDMEDRKKRAFFSLNDAKSWGYIVHEKCAVGHD